MPKLTNSFPAYCLHKASGQAVVTLSGKDCYLGPYGTAESKQTYDRLISRVASDAMFPASELADEIGREYDARCRVLLSIADGSGGKTTELIPRERSLQSRGEINRRLVLQDRLRPTQVGE